MADPLITLTARFQDSVRAAFGDEHAGVSPAIQRSDRADYQANVAMSLGKRLARAPREIAAEILSHLDLGGICDRVEIAGPGFINLTLNNDYLAREVEDTARGERLGVAPAASPETVVIDYSAPNVAKEMHVGHLRSTLIGDALARILSFLEYRVIRQNHVGDWGTPFGMLIEHLLDVGEKEPVHELSIGDLNAFYQQARAKFDADPAFVERARRRVVLFQAGDVETMSLWTLLVEQSKRYFETVYERLGVTLTSADICGESFYNAALPGVVAGLEEKGLAELSEGALCVFPEGFTGKGGAPAPLIVRKQDGGYGYAATDLAAIRHRTGALGATRLLYVVGAPQQTHFEMVFATARAAGWLASPARAEHVAFGSVLGADKKMFKTRAGGTIKLIELLDEAVERAGAEVAKKNPELDAGTRAEIAFAIGVGAVKYADLSNDRIKDYVFDWDRMLAFEGNTAPYLQYAHARIRSIFRRIDGAPAAFAAGTLVLREPAERSLALELLGLGGAVRAVAETLQPHKLCTYLYGLASAYATFYEKVPVLRADTEEQRLSRLALCDLTARVLAKGLNLLGIEVPERM